MELAVTKISRAQLVVREVVAFLFILLFVYAALSKLLDFETFRVQLAQSPLLSAYAGIIAWLVPGVEILIALLLIIPRFRVVALYASFLLMVMFTAYIFIILKFSDFIPCSCGGVLEQLSWTQHLVFNGVFIVLAVLALFIAGILPYKKKALALVGVFLFGIVVVGGLFMFSEKKMHRNNAFQRRYMPHPIQKTAEYELDYNSYYIAGMDSRNIYLGNYKAPLYLTKFDILSKKIEEFSITVSNPELPYRRIRLWVHPPNFYLGDGTVPVLFLGKLKKRYASLYFDEAYFTQFTVADSLNIGIVTISDRTNDRTLGLIQKKATGDSLIFNDNLLTRKGDGIFDSEGSLMWNDQSKRFIYVYRYRNMYWIADKKLTYLLSGKTIDTITQPILDLVHHNKTGQYTLGGKTTVINRSSSTFGDYLYIESDRLGMFDDKELTKTSDIIDIYNLRDGSYVFSFYIYRAPGIALKEFKVFGNHLAAIIGETLEIYTLKPEYSNAGYSTPHTAQYQD